MSNRPGGSSTVLYLPVEIKTRELDAAIFTAVKSVACGFVPIVGTRQAIHSHIMSRKDRSAILLWKSDIDLRLKNLYSQYLSHFCILDQEIGPSLVDYLSATVGRINGLTSKISRWYTVGPRAQEAGLQIFGERSRMVGWPRIDLWRRIELGLCSGPKDSPHRGPYVLLALTGDLSDTDNYEYFLSFINEWSSHEQTVDLIIRPHPSASNSQIERDTKELNKIFFNNDLDLLTWIENAKAVIHNGSTVAISAAFMGIQSYLIGEIQPKDLKDSSDKFFSGFISTEISTVNDFVDNNRNGSSAFTTVEEVIEETKERICMPKGSSAELMLADIGGLEVSRDSVTWFHRLRGLAPIVHYRGLRGSFGGLKRRVLDTSRSIFPLRSLEKLSSSDSPQVKFPDGLTVGDFERFRKSYDRLDFDFKILGDNLYEITEKSYSCSPIQWL